MLQQKCPNLISRPCRALKKGSLIGLVGKIIFLSLVSTTETFVTYNEVNEIHFVCLSMSRKQNMNLLHIIR